MGGRSTYHAEVGADLAHGPEVARRQELLQPADDRVAAHPHRLHQEEPPAAGLGDQVGGLVSGESERLLAQHRLARFECEQHVLAVHGVWRGDVDHVDVRVGDEGRVVGMRPGNAVRRGELLRRGQPPRPDGGQLRHRGAAPVPR